jgi:hypothetical protein
MSKIDYLDEDEKIRNQNYVCLSFLSPEDILANKDAYYISKFIQQFSKDINSLFDNLKTKFPDEESKSLLDNVRKSNSYLFDEKEMDEHFKFFKSNNYDDIEKDFHAKNNFQTTIRGLKVRGVYNTEDEARRRIETLKKKDTYFDIYMGEVGCWMPFSPNPTSIEDQEYGDQQLNTLMKKYKENKDAKDTIFDDRKMEAMKISSVEEISDEIAEKDDPWTQKGSVKESD